MKRVALVLIGLVLLASCESDAPPAPAANRGAFDFELLDWRCRHASVRTADEVVTAEGEFCFAALDVTNRGGDPAALPASCQFMVDEDDRYAPHPGVMGLDELASAGFGQEIAPGETVESSALYYDVPEGTDPDALELHERCGEPGFRLPLDPALRAD